MGVRYTEHDIKSQEFRFDRGVPFSRQPLDEYRSFDTPDPSDPRLTRGYLTGSASSDSITPRFVLNWSPNEDLNAYVSVSRGYKPGGLTIFEADGSTIPFKKESLWNYEVGAKLRGLNNRLQINGAFFFMDWEDLQIPTVEIVIREDEILNNFQIVNSKAESLGFELEAQALVMDNFVIGGGVGLPRCRVQGFRRGRPVCRQQHGF